MTVLHALNLIDHVGKPTQTLLEIQGMLVECANLVRQFMEWLVQSNAGRLFVEPHQGRCPVEGDREPLRSRDCWRLRIAGRMWFDRRWRLYPGPIGAGLVLALLAACKHHHNQNRSDAQGKEATKNEDIHDICSFHDWGATGRDKPRPVVALEASASGSSLRRSSQARYPSLQCHRA